MSFSKGDSVRVLPLYGETGDEEDQAVVGLTGTVNNPADFGFVNVTIGEDEYLFLDDELEVA